MGAGAPVYLAAVLEYLTAEHLEVASTSSRDNKKTRIIPRHIALAVKNDEELNKIPGNFTIAAGGALLNVHAVKSVKYALCCRVRSIATIKSKRDLLEFALLTETHSSRWRILLLVCMTL